MTDQTRRSWRASAATLVVVSIFALAAGVAVPLLAYLIYSRDGTPWIPIGLGVLTVLALIYAWRFGLHPRLLATESGVVVTNPFRRHEFAWDEITLIAPGENGLIVGSEDEVAEAWCVQKSNYAARRGRFTRADRVAHQLLDILDLHDPPLEDAETGLRIRRARPDEGRLLTRLERAASEDGLAHIFPPEQFPYPVTAVTRRWRKLLHDRSTRVYVLELTDSPVGFVAFDSATVLHLGVLPHHGRRGYGSALLEFASREVFDGGAGHASLWVLTDNDAARHFYRSHGWQDTDDRRECPYPPKPEERRLTKKNPSAPRRSR
ncbi:MAG TPA: GNAT family N-acetyltransferase [Propionibacteriaceae bacterium]